MSHNDRFAISGPTSNPTNSFGTKRCPVSPRSIAIKSSYLSSWAYVYDPKRPVSPPSCAAEFPRLGLQHYDHRDVSPERELLPMKNGEISKERKKRVNQKAQPFPGREQTARQENSGRADRIPNHEMRKKASRVQERQALISMEADDGKGRRRRKEVRRMANASFSNGGDVGHWDGYLR
ncbi:hypothetical protein CC80DRAFT_565110 [Byssothecium circinans]|uniref:Uncharacterized protein n=1 Tax=Byssothecium circinans TaxID=147558 RepID=A0A6A5UFV3_9PLEO|nr:hypothetical protein CC80DRAFT_565110 [Byssothecium circinans]